MTGEGEEQIMVLVSVSVLQEDSDVTFTYVQTFIDAYLCSKPTTIVDLEVPVARGVRDVCTFTALWAARVLVEMLHDKRVDHPPSLFVSASIIAARLTAGWTAGARPLPIAAAPGECLTQEA